MLPTWLFSATIWGFSLAFPETPRRPCPISSFNIVGSTTTPPLCVPLTPFLHAFLIIPGLSLQGAKIIQSFLWYLNPRQVFDLSQGGPREA